MTLYVPFVVCSFPLKEYFEPAAKVGTAKPFEVQLRLAIFLH